ncbi:winged helix-turn-helix domain-containing protein [Roseburia sp. 831b]|uniref:winged helix-turn-helix domain-containing protein n=1 Tax=Roseburia sp. 831b TaxID=1261635 RepID=UPI000952384A|nr:winged helix-turn-helix domain-containing protein [Roseburia sp. 831b]WVK72450.1 winged helix-turn-helix domain-containing protein [Roseburia sp. 831b]
MLILTFEDDEKELFQNMVEYVNTQVESLQVFDGTKDVQRYGELEIDIYRRTVTKKDKEIKLTFTEFEILLLLAQNAGRIFSKEQIYDNVWKEPYFGDYNIVMSHIRNLREKIEDNPSKPIYIQTVWGVGYRFNKNLSSGL